MLNVWNCLLACVGIFANFNFRVYMSCIIIQPVTSEFPPFLLGPKGGYRSHSECCSWDCRVCKGWGWRCCSWDCPMCKARGSFYPQRWQIASPFSKNVSACWAQSDGSAAKALSCMHLDPQLQTPILHLPFVRNTCREFHARSLGSTAPSPTSLFPCLPPTFYNDRLQFSL